MASVTGDLVPKELLPVAGKPLLQWTLEEALTAGIERAVVVTSPDKPQIAQFLSTHAPIHPSTTLVVQPEPRGLGDALTRARSVARDEAVVMMLPDNLFGSPPAAPAVGPVLDAYRRTGLSAVLIVATGGGGSAGRAECRARKDGLWDVLRVSAKAPAAPSTLTPIGRWVFDAAEFERFERVRGALPPGAELDDVPVLQQLAAEGRLIGVPLAGAFFDVGQPGGYRDALAALT